MTSQQHAVAACANGCTTAPLDCNVTFLFSFLADQISLPLILQAINGTAAASVSGRTALEPLQPLAQRRGFAAGADNEPKKAESEAAAAGGGKPEASTSQQEGIAGENETEEEKNIDELQVGLRVCAACVL